MQAFEKKILKKSAHRKKQDHLDEYQREIIKTSNKVAQIQKLNLTQLSSTSRIISFFGRTYFLVFTAIVSSALIYPLSVRFVKKIFRIKSFFNIHFAIIPIIANWNAALLGVTQGSSKNTLQMRISR